MDTIIERLLEAHVEHELARFRGKQVEQSIRETVATLFKWLKTVTLRELISAEQIIELIARNVVEPPLPGEITELASVMSRRVLAAPQNAHTALKDICPRSAYDAAVAKIASMHGARAAFIHRLVTSSVYAAQISDVLYTGIKDYLLTENILAQKVPGLASLIKFGKYAVNKTMGTLEAAVEKTVKSYIEANLANTLRRSEKSINEHFSEAHIVDMGARLWDGLAPTHLSDFARFVDAGDMDDGVALGVDFWQHFRKTRYFSAIYGDLVLAFYERHGDSTLSQLALRFGVTQKRVVTELVQLLTPVLASAAARALLEQLIRDRLEKFYRSAPAIKLIGAAQPPTPRKAKAAAAVPR